jgi:hypothetical protein
MFKWTNSIRAVSVFLCFGLLYFILLGSFFGKEPSTTILGLIGPVITGVVIAYFGKRDEKKGQESDEG